jgi:hypothetical protein
MTDLKTTQLNEKAMLVKLTMRRANLTRRDNAAEVIIQNAMDDAGLTVLCKLFRDKANPINQIMGATNEVYAYHTKHTLPYIDKGPRILPNALYLEYTQAMRDKFTHVDMLLDKFMPNYDHYVQLDIMNRSRGGTGRAKPEDYPTADEFRSRMGFDLRFMPLPDKKHFLFDMSDHDIANFTQAMHDVEVAAKTDAVTRMLEPLKHLVDKLNKPIGTEGAVFRDTTIENVAQGLEVARKLLLDDCPELSRVINQLDTEVSKYIQHKDWLRESPVVREQAAKQLDDIARQMGAFMGA